MDTTWLLYWIKEREEIRLRRQAGAPPPWTDNLILREWPFCNVRREDDRVTRWIAVNWRQVHASDPDLYLAMAVARYVNWPDSLAALGYPVPWDCEHFTAVMQARTLSDDTAWGPAYDATAG